jgi:urea transport system substrate-binding protein
MARDEIEVTMGSLLRRPLTRRSFLSAGGLVMGGLGLAACSASRGGSESGGGAVTVGSLLDATGPINIYGKPLIDATNFAVDDINKKGGVLGRQLKLVSFDTQSDNDKYAQFANTLILNDRPAVVMGGITSASREAIRPLMDRGRQLYFYNEQYEGGVCDKLVFCTGVVPSQQLSTLIAYAAENGSRKVHTLAADYNYGHISSDWVKYYIAKQPSMRQVGLDFFPLDVTDFSSAITKLQASGADTVMSLLVGGNHISFYRQFAAAGLKDKIKVVSPTYGLGNEQVVLAPKEGQGIVVAFPYFQELSNPTNKRWVADWHARYGANYPYITDSAQAAWIGWHLWAMAVDKAGTTTADAVVKALESGLSFDAPEGTVRLDPRSHHLVHNVSIGVGNASHGFDLVRSYAAIGPDPQGQCDLLTNPGQHTQLTPTVS